MRYLGVDYGLKKTGLAIGDGETKIASPIGVVAGGEASYPEIRRLLLEEGIDAIVVGMPEREGAQRDATILFIERLEERLDQPVYTVDEGFTSKESQRLRAETGTDAPEDALAAMLILEDYFGRT